MYAGFGFDVGGDGVAFAQGAAGKRDGAKRLGIHGTLERNDVADPSGSDDESME
jgi:hypothetical protein